MEKKAQSRKRYPSDLTDEQVLNTLFSLNRSGCQWDMLPHDVLPKRTVYDSFAQWRDAGTWAKIVTA
jgi:putative transposase